MELSYTAKQLKQEKANSFIHAIGILFGLISMPALISLAIETNNINNVIAATAYGFSFVLVFTCSTLFHGIKKPRWKQIMKIMDHISIYYLIAGTYTPLVLLYLHDYTGQIILTILWSAAIIGTFFKIYYTGRWEIMSTFIYVVLGWIMILKINTFYQVMPSPIFTLVCAGGALYSLGVIFYLWKKYTYHHAVWHSMVLIGAICHYSAIFMSLSGH